MSKTIMISGASSGIGRTTAEYFQAKGWNVVATMRAPEKETELTELENVLVTRLDVQDSASIEDAVTAGIARFGKIDVLLNNAGYGAYGLLEATPNEKIRWQFDVNVIGLFATTRAVLRSQLFRSRRTSFKGDASGARPVGDPPAVARSAPRAACSHTPAVLSK